MIDVFESFSGYGGGSFGLTKAKINHRVIGYSEIDKYACKCFEQNHKNVPAYGDITKIDWEKVPDFDLLTGGFPCGDISQAGKQDLSKGRSTLVFELIKALEIKQPEYFLFENVPAIEQEKFREFLSLAENGMKKAGYKVYRKSLNTKHFGIPQNRNRIWFIGYRKDIAPEFGFTPYPIETGCTLRLLDVCDEKVDEKYYLSDKAVNYLIKRTKDNLENNRGFGAIFNPDICSTIDSRYGALRNAGETYITSPIELTKNISQAERVYDSKGLAITLSSQGGGMGAKTGLYLFPNATKQGYAIAREGDGVRLQHMDSKTARGRVISQMAHTLQTNGTEGVIQYNRIRRLTPTECFRLMGFQDGQININGISDTQRYRLAGNGWDIHLVSKIFERMKMGSE